MEFEFKRKRVGNSSCHQPGDIYISTINHATTKQSRQIVVRFTENSLDRLRWRAGDRVTWKVQIEGDKQTWTFFKTENELEGLKLSAASSGAKTCNVKRSISKSERQGIFGSVEFMNAYMVIGNSDSAVFEVR